MAEHYDDTRGGEERGDDFAAMIHARLPSAPGPVLDVGAGTGVIELGLRRRGRSVVGVDVSLGMLTRARERLDARVVVADGRALPFSTASIAHALSVWVIHHVPEPDSLFAEAYRVLRPGGMFLICPNYRESPEDPIGPIISSMHQRANKIRRGWQLRPMDAVAVLAQAERSGFAGSIEPFEGRPRRTSAQELTASIHQRAFPALVGLDQADFEAVAGPALAELNALPEGVITRPSLTDVVLLQRN